MAWATSRSKPGQADVKPCSEEVNVARMAQVYFGIDGYVSRKRDLHPVGHKAHRTNETGGPTSGKQLLRIRASSWTPGAENLTSKRPSSLWETPPRRPPEVWVLAVYRTVMPSWAEPDAALVF